jgi:hypothetical protein
MHATQAPYRLRASGPDRILPPITKRAAVTTSLEAGELAVGMITLLEEA